MSGPALIILFLASMVYLFVTIVRFKMNPFFSMISAAIAIGVLAGMDLNELVNGITSGFGSICAGLGIVVAMGFLLGGWLYGEFLGKKLYKYEEPVDEAAAQSVPTEKNDTKRAPAGLAIAIIALPLLLIVFGTLIPMWTSNPMAVSVCKFLTAGNGVISLIISVAFAALTLRPYVKGSYAPLITKNFNEMGEIMLLLGAGGSFGAIIQASGIGNYFVTLLQSWNVPLIVLAFLLCLLMRSALGSAAVAMVTTSSIVAPLCVQMGESGIVMGLAICAASMAFATPTDAAFWLVQKLNNLSFKDTWITHTFGNAIACVVMFAIVILLNMCRGFLPGL